MKKKFGSSNSLVVVCVIFLVVLVGLSWIFYANLTKGETVKADATVVLVGDDYIVVEDSDGVEYSIDTDDEYNLGDRVSFVMENVDKKSKIKEGKVTKLDTISKSINFTIDDSNGEVQNGSDSQETNDGVANGGNLGNQNTYSDSGVNNSVGTDDEVVSYVEELNNRMDTYNSDKSIGESLKSGFVTVVDFLFYGGTIKGKTFSELSTKAKLQVLKLAFSVDSKIERYFPGYKEKISTTSKKIYTNVKSKAMELYLDISTKVCSNDPDTCYFAKEGLGDLKSSFSLTWDFIKDISGVGLSKLKAWYEVWREA